MTVPLYIVALIVAHMFDLFSFLVMTQRHGMAAEANPIVVMLEQQIGLAGLTVFKLASVLAGASTFVILARHRRRLAFGVIVFGVCAGLVGGFSNVATIAVR